MVALGILLSKIRHYISTLTLIKGLFVSLCLSAFIYLDAFDINYKALDTLLAMMGFYLLFKSNRYVFFWVGFFTSLLWFWWIAVSFIHYDMIYLIPFLLLAIGLIYGFLFLGIYTLSDRFSNIYIKMTILSISLLLLSYIHPFGFDWFKPELTFVNSYFGVSKWQFAIILASITLTITQKNYLFLALSLLSFNPHHPTISYTNSDIKLVSTYIDVKDKWDESKKEANNQKMLSYIDQAILRGYKTVVLPESVFIDFINYNQSLFDALKQRAKHINIITGGLYLDGKIPRNSTYIFTRDGKVQVAHKYILVPFGESNPLPKFLSDWVNETFYGGAVDYKASDHISTYKLDDKTYTNTICFEATSDKLYQNHPKAIIAISNNGWFYPSTEPTLQKLLLKYYATIYHTTIYHAINMSKSYIISLPN